MPKKFGTNTKKEEARLKVQQQKITQKIIEEEEKEASKWVETDKKVLAQLERKKQEEEKKLQELERKKENKKLYEEDMASYTTKNKQDSNDGKLTRAQIKAQNQKLLLQSLQKNLGTSSKTEERKSDNGDSNGGDNEDNGSHDSDYDDIEINPNRIQAEQDEFDRQNYSEVIKATGIDEALGKLDLKVDKHPEKRVKAAFSTYVDQELPRLKVENPSLKRSQLMEIIEKNWKKAPENPFNQPHLDFNEKVRK